MIMIVKFRRKSESYGRLLYPQQQWISELSNIKYLSDCVEAFLSIETFILRPPDIIISNKGSIRNENIK
jgi:hypothetical protein